MSGKFEFAHDKLAAACLAARRDPAARPDFYRVLWEAEVYVVGMVEESGEEERNYQLSFFEIEGREVLPFFSSLELMKQVIPEGQLVAAVSARHLLTSMPDDLVLMLNPCTESGKEFTSPELRALRTGLLFEDYAPVETPEDEQIVFGEPKEVPERLVAALKKQLATMPSVRSAHLALAFVPSRGRMPYPVIGLEFEPEAGATFLDVMLDLHVYVRDRVDKELYMEFHEIFIGDTGELTRYFLEETTPFYTVAN